MTTHVVFVTQPVPAAAIDILEQKVRVITGYGPNANNIADHVTHVDAILTRTTPLDSDLIMRAPRLKVICRVGVGIDHVDVEAATQQGVVVAITPNANYRAVAEHVFAMLLGFLRSIRQLDEAVRDGRFDDRAIHIGKELNNRTLGVVGLGRTGTEVARIGSEGFGMKVLAYTHRPEVVTPPPGTTIVTTLQSLLAVADVVSLHVPLTAQTRGLIGEREIGLMPAASVLVNTSRGAIIDELALARAIDEGRIGGACLDVFGEEPPDPTHPLLGSPRTLVTAHSAGLTEEALLNGSVAAAETIVTVLGGRVPETGCVMNPQILPSQ